MRNPPPVTSVCFVIMCLVGQSFWSIWWYQAGLPTVFSFSSDEQDGDTYSEGQASLSNDTQGDMQNLAHQSASDGEEYDSGSDHRMDREHSFGQHTMEVESSTDGALPGVRALDEPPPASALIPLSDRSRCRSPRVSSQT